MAGNIDTRTEIIPANGVVKLPNANFIFVISSSGNVALQLIRAGLRPGAAQENYTGQLAGLQISRVNAWDFASMTGAPGVTITFMYGNVSLRDDTTLFNQQIAVISGVTAIAAQPSSTIVNNGSVICTQGTQTALFAANLSRRRITVTSVSTNTQSIFIRKGGGTADLLEIQPGTFVEFDTTAALDARVAAGVDQTALLFEET